MSQHNTINFVYFLNKNEKGSKKTGDTHLSTKLQQILDTLSKQAMKEKTLSLLSLNQIPYNYTVKVRNRFQGLDLIDRVPDEL